LDVLLDELLPPRATETLVVATEVGLALVAGHLAQGLDIERITDVAALAYVHG
jgi:hypothetical protein